MAIPSPPIRPGTKPWARVVRRHKSAMGPTGAAIDRPSTVPLTNRSASPLTAAGSARGHGGGHGGGMGGGARGVPGAVDRVRGFSSTATPAGAEARAGALPRYRAGPARGEIVRAKRQPLGFVILSNHRGPVPRLWPEKPAGLCWALEGSDRRPFGGIRPRFQTW